MKHEWKKADKEFYLPKSKPSALTVPPFLFFTLTGAGNPNSADFSERVSALYTLSYAVRMMPKQGFTPEGYFEYTVYPLEGVWSGGTGAGLVKDDLVYKIMIRQPAFVTAEVCGRARDSAKRKKSHPLLDEIAMETVEDGPCVQLMHIGAYDNEPESFAKMDGYLRENNLVRTGAEHREIYISNPQKTEPNHRKTVLRYCVRNG